MGKLLPQQVLSVRVAQGIVQRAEIDFRLCVLDMPLSRFVFCFEVVLARSIRAADKRLIAIADQLQLNRNWSITNRQHLTLIQNTTEGFEQDRLRILWLDTTVGACIEPRFVRHLTSNLENLP